MTTQMKLELSAEYHDAKQAAHRSLSHRLENLNEDMARAGIEEDDFNADWYVDVNDDGEVAAVIEVTVYLSGVPEANFMKHLHNHGYTTKRVDNMAEHTVIRLRDARSFGGVHG